MGLNGIDVSGWQEGIDLSAVAADFVIMKATQGTGFVSKDLLDSISRQKKMESLSDVITMPREAIMLQRQTISLMLLEIASEKLFFVLIGKDRIIQHLVRTISIGLKDSVIMYSLRLV